jgi:O-acetyl-ADP-ribose deacetylase (regulator of RNase III)
VLVHAPRWKPTGGQDHLLAEAYRSALAAARERGATSLVLPAALVVGWWPMEDVTRVALTVLMSTPSPAREVTIAVPTPAMLEIWAEALVREP